MASAQMHVKRVNNVPKEAAWAFVLRPPQRSVMEDVLVQRTAHNTAGSAEIHAKINRSVQRASALVCKGNHFVVTSASTSSQIAFIAASVTIDVQPEKYAQVANVHALVRPQRSSVMVDVSM